MNTPWTTRLAAAACAVTTASLIFASVVGLAQLPGDAGVAPAAAVVVAVALPA